MASNAMSLSGVVGHRGGTSEDILSLGNSLQVFGVDTAPVAAQVVNLEAFGDVPLMLLVYQPVGILPTNPAVPFHTDRARPGNAVAHHNLLAAIVFKLVVSPGQSVDFGVQGLRRAWTLFGGYLRFLVAILRQVVHLGVDDEAALVLLLAVGTALRQLFPTEPFVPVIKLVVVGVVVSI